MNYRLLIIITLTQLLTFSCTEQTSSSILEMDVTTLELSVGDKEKINITQAPDNGGTLEWSSDNESVATVYFGTVTALKGGTAVITATMGDASAECLVTVATQDYQLVWADEFNGNELNTDYWTIEVNGYGGGNNEEQYYTDRPENIRVADGLLTIEARKEEYLGKQYTSARIVTKDKKDFAYAKVETRIKVPSGRGTWPALWLLGYGSWPDAGEIDFLEHVGYEPYIMHCALHTANKNGMNGQNFKASQTLENPAADDFHIMTMEWVKNEFMGYDRIHIYVDGIKTTTFGETQQLQDSGDWPFNDQFFFILNLAIGGNWGGIQGIDDTIFDSPVLYQVDYIRVYQLQ